MGLTLADLRELTADLPDDTAIFVAVRRPDEPDDFDFTKATDASVDLSLGMSVVIDLD